MQEDILSSSGQALLQSFVRWVEDSGPFATCRHFRQESKWSFVPGGQTLDSSLPDRLRAKATEGKKCSEQRPCGSLLRDLLQGPRKWTSGALHRTEPTRTGWLGRVRWGFARRSLGTTGLGWTKDCPTGWAPKAFLSERVCSKHDNRDDTQLQRAEARTWL